MGLHIGYKCKCQQNLVWMGFLGVIGFMALFWTAHRLYQKVRKVKPAQGRENSPGPSVFVGVIAGFVVFMLLELIVGILLSPIVGQVSAHRLIGNILRLAALVAAVWAGVRIYRFHRKRAAYKESSEGS